MKIQFPSNKALIALVALTTLVHSGLAAPKAASGDCYSSIIVSPSPFMGNNGEIFKLADGTIWKVKYEYEYLYEYQPEVVICPAKGKLLVAKKSLNVELLSSAKPKSGSAAGSATVESRVDGEFNGWTGETIVKLRNGQIWQQRRHYYFYRYAYAPNVIVYPSDGVMKMKVEGVDEAVPVRLLNP